MITKQERLNALENQINRLQRRLANLNRRSDRYSWIRLAIFLVGALLSVVAFFLLGWLWGLIPGAITLIIFNIVAYYHRKVDRSITRHKIWLQIKATQVARVQLDWPDIPAVNSRAPVADHPFATDLDITGERSLHQLINTAISYEGSQRVCEWLLNSRPDLQTIRSRQALVQELAPLSRFRSKLTLKSILAVKNVAEQWEGKRLLSWLDAHAAAPPRSLRLSFWVATILSALTIILFLLNIFALLGPQFWIISLLLSVGWFYVKRGQRGDLFEDAYFLRDAFAQLSMVFEYLETYPYGKNEHLKKLCEPFFSNREHRPSTLLQRLSRIASAATLEKNQVIWRVDGLDREQAESLLHSLAVQFRGDIAATDISRVLRMPGFANRKYNEQFLVRAIQETDTIYHLRDFTMHEDSPEAPRRLSDGHNSPHRMPAGHRSQSEADWAYAKRALARGDDPTEIVQRIADYRADDKADPFYYAELTVRKARTEISRVPTPSAGISEVVQEIPSVISRE